MPKANTLEFKVPTDLGTRADLLQATRIARLELQKQVDELASRESAMRQAFIDEFTVEGATVTGATGRSAHASLVEKEEPQAEDWDATYKWISKTKSWDLLQRRISAPAVRARWEAGKEIPGIKRVKIYTISVTKV